MGKFIKGQSGNPKGRPKGIPNKSTNFRVGLIEGGFDFASEWLKAYQELETPHDRLSALMAAAPFLYCKPKTEKAEDPRVLIVVPDNGRAHGPTHREVHTPKSKIYKKLDDEDVPSG